MGSEKHHVTKGKNAGISQQDVETGHQRGKNHDLQSQVQGLEGGEQERGDDKGGQNSDLQIKEGMRKAPHFFLAAKYLNRCLFNHE